MAPLGTITIQFVESYLKPYTESHVVTLQDGGSVPT